MGRLTVWGASYSVFSRMVQLALLEKDRPFEWIERDVFDAPEDRAEQATRHPWAKVPAIGHDGVTIYETRACLAYLEAPEFGPPMMPEGALARARAEQVYSIAASYAYPVMVWDVFVEMVGRPAEGLAPDTDRVARGLAASETVMDALEEIVAEGHVLDGARASLADVALAPMMAYFTCVGPARLLLAGRPRLRAWWHSWRERPSMMATRSPLEDA